MYSSIRRRRHNRRRVFFVVAVAALVLLVIATATILPRLLGSEASSPDSPDVASETTARKADANASNAPGDGRRREETTDQEDKVPVRAIYLTAQSASDIDPFLQTLDRTEANAVVVDVKDVTGEVMYQSEVPLANEIGATRDILDLPRLTKKLEDRDVYSIARVAIFEDDILPVARPDLAATDSSTGAQWTNNVGNYWSDPYNREVWKYNAAIAKEAAEAGFDEVQFDYVRYPSDGPMETLTFPSEPQSEGKDSNTIVDFLAYADKELESTDAKLAADVFGLAAGDNGAGVGQDVAAFAPYLDVISPMVYPSHFPVGSYGLDDPNSEPYTVLENALAEFEEETRDSNPDIEIRPWLQDFTYGTPAYGPAEVRAQIKATYDSGEDGWLLWNAENVYTEAAFGGEASAASSQYEATN